MWSSAKWISSWQDLLGLCRKMNHMQSQPDLQLFPIPFIYICPMFFSVSVLEITTSTANMVFDPNTRQTWCWNYGMHSSAPFNWFDFFCCCLSHVSCLLSCLFILTYFIFSLSMYLYLRNIKSNKNRVHCYNYNRVHLLTFAWLLFWNSIFLIERFVKKAE